MNGAHAQRHANKENNQEHVNVIHQLHDMEGRNVMASPRIQESVTTKYHVQVIGKVTVLDYQLRLKIAHHVNFRDAATLLDD